MFKEQFTKQKGLCFWCLLPMYYKGDYNDGTSSTKEHLIDRLDTKNGKRPNRPNNIVILSPSKVAGRKIKPQTGFGKTSVLKV